MTTESFPKELESFRQHISELYLAYNRICRYEIDGDKGDRIFRSLVGAFQHITPSDFIMACQRHFLGLPRNEELQNIKRVLLFEITELYKTCKPLRLNPRIPFLSVFQEDYRVFLFASQLLENYEDDDFPAERVISAIHKSLNDVALAIEQMIPSQPKEKSEPPQPKQKRDTEIEKLDWQGSQAQLVFLIEQLYEQGFLSSITQSEKFSLLSQHFTVKGESLNPRTLAQTRQNSLNTKKGKPKAVEKIEQIISAAKKQNP